MSADDLNFPPTHPIGKSIQDILQKQNGGSTSNANDLIVALTTGLVELEKRVVYLEVALKLLGKNVGQNAELAKAVREIFPES